MSTESVGAAGDWAQMEFPVRNRKKNSTKVLMLMVDS
jgi:hypothetical protein